MCRRKVPNNDTNENEDCDFNEPNEEPINRNIVQLKLDSEVSDKKEDKDKDSEFDESDDKSPNKNIVQLVELDSEDESDCNISADTTWSLASDEDEEELSTNSVLEQEEPNVGSNEFTLYSTHNGEHLQ